VTLNDHLDYFGQTVNVAARVQGLADSRSIYISGNVIDHPGASKLLKETGVRPMEQHASLRGITGSVRVYQIP
jgi:class 3 adenylate cyclase